MTEISDKSFDISRTANYTLSIRKSPNGFCFAVFDEEKKLVHFLLSKKDYGSDIQLLHKEFRQVFFCHDDNRYTLLPASLFNPELKADYWRLNFGEETAADTLRSEVIPLTDIVTLYPSDEKDLKNLKECFPIIQTVHRQTVQIAVATMLSKRNIGQQLFLHFAEKERFDAILMEKGRLILANTYERRSADEFLFHVLNLFDQMKLDQYQTEVVLEGPNDGSEKQLLSQYVQSVQEKSMTLREISTAFERIKEYGSTTFLNIPYIIS